MNSFSISELQQFSGIKAHTIRIWEQRYQALTPRRSEGNTRYYDGGQLKRLLNIVSLMNAEYKVSELCTMSDEKLSALLEARLHEHIAPENTYEYFTTQIMAAALEYDEARFDKVFSNALLRFGLSKTYIGVLYPALVRLGLMWANETLRPAHEHYITNLFRQKIASATDALPPPQSAKQTWLLFLPENEFHETGLLFANFLIRQAGHRVIYLGSNLPLESLKTATKQVKPDSLLFFWVRKNDKENDQQFINDLCKYFGDLNIFVACEAGRLTKLKRAKNLVALHGVQDLQNILQQIV